MVLELLTVEPHDCVLAIVGARDVPAYAAESMIRQEIARHKPRCVVSGGARGVDTEARQIAIEMGISFIEFVAEVPTWDYPASTSGPMETIAGEAMVITVPGGFVQRNQRIAEACTCLVRIYAPSTTTYGSGWTADYAEKIGKHVTRHLVG